MLVQATHAEVGLALLISVAPGALLVDLPQGQLEPAGYIRGQPRILRKIKRAKDPARLGAGWGIGVSWRPDPGVTLGPCVSPSRSEPGPQPVRNAEP